MLKRRLCLLLVLVCAVMPVVTGCSKRSSDKSSFLLTAAKNTAPTVKGTVTTLAMAHQKKWFFDLISTAYATPVTPSDCASTYGYMCLGWEIFTLIRDYDPVADQNAQPEDKIGSENMYADLDFAGGAYEKLSLLAEVLPESKSIASPFNFGSTNIADETYDKAKVGITTIDGAFYTKAEAHVAVRDDGTTKHFLLAMGSNEDSGWTAGRHKAVMQGVYNKTTGDIELNYVWYMNYPSDQGSMADHTLIERTYIKGNEQTHYFEIMAGSTNDGSGAAFHNWASIQGAGYSKGDGQHFLVYYRGTNGARDQNGVVGAGTSGGYYCISADTTKALFGSAIYAKPVGYTADTIPADCAAFGATVAAMPRWEITDYATVNPTSLDYPLTMDSALFIGTGAQRLGLAL